MRQGTVNVMVDIETLGLEPGSVILSIGATTFDTPNATRNMFYECISVASCEAEGFVKDKHVMDWWKEQNQDLYKDVISGTTHISKALSDFSNYLHDLKADVVIWGNGADFDISHLKRAFDICGLIWPVHYRNVRCYRTLRNIFPYVIPIGEESLRKHHALDDAVFQAVHAEALLNWSRRFQKVEEPVWSPI